MDGHYVIFSESHVARLFPDRPRLVAAVAMMIEHGSPVLVTLTGRKYTVEPIQNGGDCDTGAREAQLDAQIARDQGQAR